MAAYVIRRVIYAVVTLLVISVVAYVIIQLPPGDYLTSYIMRLEMQGGEVTDAEVETLKREYGLDLPPHLRYFKWMANLLRGDLGRSFFYNRPVLELLAERLPLSLLVSLLALLFTYLVSIPVGIYSATHQYSLWDYTLSLVGFVGLATPNFILALLLMFFFFKTFGLSIGGLFSPEYLLEPWSWGKFVDLLKHLPVPVIVIGTAGTAGLIRVMRGLMLDEMAKQYVVTARAKGVGERRLLFKYPVRVSLNPIVSTIRLDPAGDRVRPDDYRHRAEPAHGGAAAAGGAGQRGYHPGRQRGDDPELSHRARDPAVRPAAGGAGPAHPLRGRQPLMRRMPGP